MSIQLALIRNAIDQIVVIARENGKKGIENQIEHTKAKEQKVYHEI